MSDRTVLLLAHTGRPEALEVAREVVDRLDAAAVGVRMLPDEAAELGLEALAQPADGADPVEGCELVVVLGGDGTILRGAELALPWGTPLLGVNLGHVGFLAEAEPDALSTTVQAVVDRSYEVEERLTVDVEVLSGGRTFWQGWALNEVAVEKTGRARMLEVVAEVDGLPLSRWGCDGVVMATPTGSTAYAFSAGGPVVWPEVEALLLVPISAHALFARPLVVAPSSVLAVELAPSTRGATLTCDGRRGIEVPPGARVEVRRGRADVRLARLHEAPFTSRLVAKFDLPVEGWRRQRPVEARSSAEATADTVEARSSAEAAASTSGARSPTEAAPGATTRQVPGEAPGPVGAGS